MKAKAYILNSLRGWGTLTGQLKGCASVTERQSLKPVRHPNFILADGRYLKLADGRYFNVRKI